ncbi:AAA family ATPase [Pseudomonas sp. GD03858]|uniref:AAA family ATPase n=1 Tax=unclassified Pseudomonas TaxID=196821 RepID=UPI00244C19F8|nr:MULTISPECIES: AAA family ATPase [unclassified Pseudomonas]MDH0647339.1 AAA family ATPase [Pseudomonas sp. GD03867]MDH0664289.1 AAA family ATPase [Pseudomonas sp. GD03858]
MNLIHLYVLDHKALYDLNVPFSSQFICKVERKGAISIHRRHDWVDFYDGYQCQAIIGQNGAGKSTILEALSALDGESESQIVAIFHDGERDECFICFTNLSAHGFEVRHCEMRYTYVTETSRFLAEHGLELVHVNSISGNGPGFAQRARPKTTGAVKHLTIAQATHSRAARKRYFNRYLNYFEHYPREPYQENIRFVFSFSRSSVGLVEKAMDVAEDSADISLLREWLGAFAAMRTKLFEPLSDNVGDKLIEMNVPSILQSISKLASSDLSSFPALMRRYVIADLDLNLSIREKLAESIPGWAHELSLPKPSRMTLHNDALKQLAAVVATLEDIGVQLYLESPNEDWLETAGVVIESFEAVENLRSLVNRLPDTVARNIHWGWRGASTGELARAHIFSELFNYLSELPQDQTPIILIDEADLYLHPEWQRKFLSDLLALFRRVRSGSPPQLILCTHSPIMVSDFLADDITSLTQDEYGHPTCSRSCGFGSSIADIYMADMHLESTFGEHARRKLADLLDNAEASELDEADRLLISKISNQNLKNLLLAHDQDQQETQH